MIKKLLLVKRLEITDLDYMTYHTGGNESLTHYFVGYFCLQWNCNSISNNFIMNTSSCFWALTMDPVRLQCLIYFAYLLLTGTPRNRLCYLHCWKLLNTLPKATHQEPQSLSPSEITTPYISKRQILRAQGPSTTHHTCCLCSPLQHAFLPYLHILTYA